jgi:hypothetical protein
MALFTISEVRGCDGFAFAFFDAADAFFADAGAGDAADAAAAGAASAMVSNVDVDVRKKCDEKRERTKSCVDVRV